MLPASGEHVHDHSGWPDDVCSAYIVVPDATNTAVSSDDRAAVDRTDAAVFTTHLSVPV